ncbi:hypothetical protein KCU90_g178, partial [Aureobasidium melanogenum]
MLQTQGIPMLCDTLGLRTRQVVGRDPGLVVGLSTAGNSRAVSTNNADLVGRIDLLGTTRRTLGTLTTLAATLLLREEGSDPSVVDEVDSTSEDTAEDKVEEDAACQLAQAHGSLDNRDSAVESRVGVEHAHVVLENGGQVEGQVLGVHFGSEAVGCSLLLASRDQKVVLAEGQVADSLGTDEGATNEAKVDGGSFMVGDGQDGETETATFNLGVCWTSGSSISSTISGAYARHQLDSLNCLPLTRDEPEHTILTGLDVWYTMSSQKSRRTRELRGGKELHCNLQTTDDGSIHVVHLWWKPAGRGSDGRRCIQHPNTRYRGYMQTCVPQALMSPAPSRCTCKGDRVHICRQGMDSCDEDGVGGSLSLVEL